MRSLLVCLLAGLLLSGCAARVVSSSPRTVVVKAPDMFISESQELANKECAKHNRYARMVAQPTIFSSEFIFDCIQ
jgi:uncharacterized protein YceK